MPSPHAKSPDVHAQEAYEPPSPSQPQHAHEPYSSHPLNSPLSTAENYSAGSMSAPLLSPDSARQSIGFTKAAFAFHDRLGSLRRKRASQSTSVVSGPESDISPTKDGSASTEDSPPQKGIKILRILQRTLTALLSLAIAFFQGRVYYTYKRTEHVPGCWPKTPQLMPTLLLFSVAIATFTFDVCMLLAYVARSKRYAQKFYNIAMNAHYIATSAKAVAYALTSIVCRLGFNFGNSSDTHMDLWSWTCTAKAAEQKQMNQAPSNCDTQTIAWFFALAQVAIELIGVVIGLLVFQQKLSSLGKEGTEEGATSSPVNSRYEKLNALSSEVDAELGDVTPEIDARAHF